MGIIDYIKSLKRKREAILDGVSTCYLCKSLSVENQRKKTGTMIDVTRNAVWNEDWCGKMDLDFPLVSCETRYCPDNTCKCHFRLCAGVYNYDEEEWNEPYDAITIMESDYISGDSKEECQMKARQWYNDNAVHALELAISKLTKD